MHAPKTNPELHPTSTLNLYEADFYAWTQEQAILLHNQQWSQIDLPNLIEEIESLVDPLPLLKPVGFRAQAETAGKACLTSPTPTDKTLPVFAIENRDDRNRIFTSRESIVQSYHAGRAKNDSVAEAATREPLLHPTSKARWALRVPQPSLSSKV